MTKFRNFFIKLRCLSYALFRQTNFRNTEIKVKSMILFQNLNSNMILKMRL